MNKLHAFKRTDAILAAFVLAAAAMFSSSGNAQAGECAKNTRIYPVGYVRASLSNEDDRNFIERLVGAKKTDPVRSVEKVFMNFCLSARDKNVVLYGSDTDLNNNDKAKRVLFEAVVGSQAFAGKRLVPVERDQTFSAVIPRGGNTQVAKLDAKQKPQNQAVAANAAKPKSQAKAPQVMAGIKLPKPRPNIEAEMAAKAAPVQVAAAAKPAPVVVSGGKSSAVLPKQISHPAVASFFARMSADIFGAGVQSKGSVANKPEPMVASMPAVAISAARSRSDAKTGSGVNRTRTTSLPEDPMGKVPRRAPSRAGTQNTALSTGAAQLRIRSLAGWPTAQVG